MLNLRAHALKFELNKADCSTSMEFKYDSSNPLTEQAFEKINIPCFDLHFANFHCSAKFGSLLESITYDVMKG